ncbi:hypothetical protein R0K05_13225 [Planococcus sp. SIMBA_160]
MGYFVDHRTKKIHHSQFAGDSCGFLQTPINQREFTDKMEYVESLAEKEYERCPHCQTAQPTVG